MVCRAVILSTLILVIFGANPAPSLAVSKPSLHAGTLSHASILLKHERPNAVLRWLTRQPSIRSARLGRDHRALDIRFRDGLRAVILPAGTGTVKIGGQVVHSRLLPLARARQTPGARALVLEPFATELGMGPYAGSSEVADLQTAGFQVDQSYDTKVTVDTLATLSRYNVVYMHTHSGVNSSGEGVLASGQPATSSPSPSIAAKLNDGSVVVVTVAGTTQLYYGITSRYIQRYEPTFAHDSLLFFNGCSFLRASIFWQALAAKGAGVMVSWDEDSATVDDYTSGVAFFHQMAQGASVAGAISAMRASGSGTSQSGGLTATLGYVGDGTITLQRAAAGNSGGSTPGPTSTPVPPTPTPGPGPTPTPTVISGPPLSAVLRGSVGSGSKQVITARSRPNMAVRFQVTFPNGDTRSYSRTTGAAGAVTISFTQPSSEISRTNTVATVTIQAGSGIGVSTVIKKYRIILGRIDVAVQPRAAATGKAVAIWVHTRARTAVTVSLSLVKHRLKSLSGRTNRSGWAQLRYTVGSGLKSGNVVNVSAAVSLAHRHYRTGTTFTVR